MRLVYACMLGLVSRSPERIIKAVTGAQQEVEPRVLAAFVNGTRDARKASGYHG